MSSLNKRVKILWLLILLNSASTLNAQKSKDWDLAMHGFTFRYSTFTDVLNKTKALGINHVEVYFGQLLGDGFPEGEKIHYRTITPEVSKKLKALLKENGMTIVSAGVVRPGDETDWRKLFAFAKEFGLLVINAEPPSPSVQTFEMIDRLAGEYGVKVAIHNHKTPSTYWDPKVIVELIKNSNSTHIGINADLGHWVRSGLDPLQCIRNYGKNIMSIHLKDVDEESHDCIWGAGTCNLQEVFRELKHQQFKGIFTIEYESKSPTLDEDLKESISFFRKQSMKEPVCSPYVALEFNMKVPVNFFRAAPVNLGTNQKGFVTLFSEESNIDPFEGSFRFPENTPKLAVFTQDGKELWRCELPYSIPGIWFIPVLPFDMNRNGIDEIYYVANTGKLPFNYDTYKLVQADALTGRVTGQWDWTAPSHNQANSYKWRFFLIGGYVRNEPVLVTTQGTYRDMKLQAWNTDMRSRWTVTYPDDFKGSRGSHSTPVLDINNDGSYEFMYGERCISFDTGKELFVLDGEVWGDHSDMVLPVFNASDNQWNFFTTREKGDDGRLSRSVMFNQEGEHLWEISDKKGHYHYGWVGNFGAKGERIAMAGRYPLKSENLPEKTCVGKTYDANTGDEVPIHFPLTGIVIDFNGDGIHEIYHDNSMYNNQGEKLFSTEKGTIAIAKKILNLPGEQLMLALPDGRVQIWADRNAKDTLAQKKRFADLMYYENVRHSASGYNFRLPILNF